MAQFHVFVAIDVVREEIEDLLDGREDGAVVGKARYGVLDLGEGCADVAVGLERRVDGGEHRGDALHVSRKRCNGRLQEPDRVVGAGKAFGQGRLEGLEFRLQTGGLARHR